jgi:E3 SUMO-protein ligase RanBP2
MEQRIKNLEDLCELITKEIVEQNKNVIEMNKNLITEIRSLREAYVKQDEDFEEFKILLKKIYDLNRQNPNGFNLFPTNFVQPQPPPPSFNLAQLAQNLPPLAQPPQQPVISSLPGHQANMANVSYMGDQINQSMLNNLSFQSERTPFHPHIANTTINSIPSSASALNQQLKLTQNILPPTLLPQQQQQTQNLPQFQKPVDQKQTVFNPQIPPPTFSDKSSQSNQPLKFAPLINTTSTPQAFVPKPTEWNETKPPVFQFSPSKPLPETKNKPIDKPIENVKASEPSKLTPENLYQEEETDGNPEEYEPEVEFKPIVQLKAVEVKTGEEDEDVILKQRCKLFRLDTNAKEWKEKGVGELKLLKHKKTDVIRLLMRRDQVLKLCANHRITPDLKLNVISGKQMSWMAVDFSENEPKSELLLAKFKSEEEATQFKQEFEKAVSKAKMASPTKPAPKTTTSTAQVSDKPSLGQLFKSNDWKCTACYAPNKLDVVKCACCGTLKPGAEPPKPAESTQPAAQPKFSFGLQTNQAPSNSKPAISFGATPAQTDQSTKPLFGQSTSGSVFSFSALGTKPAATATPTTKPEENKSQPTFSFTSPLNQQQQTKPFSFGSFTTSNTQATNITTTATSTTTNNSQQPNQQQQQQNKSIFSFGTISNPQTTSGLNTLNQTAPNTASPFASLAGQGANLFGNIETPKADSVFKPFALNTSSTTTPLTDKKKEDEDGEDDQNPEEYEPQVEFKPLVNLKEVEVKTGEENEDVVFNQRCKLYRFDKATGEWKEKGTGEMKVLKHKTNANMYRILMRREQILKLCANHRITNDLKFEIFNEKQVRWFAQDYSESEGQHETLAARFKSQTEANQFKKICEEAQKDAATTPENKPAEKTLTNGTPSTTSNASCEGLKQNFTNMFQTEIKEIQIPNENKPVFSFGGATTNTEKKVDFATTSLFATNTIAPKNEAPKTIESVFGAKSGLSFQDLAKGSDSKGFTGGFQKPAINSSVFGKPVTPLFGATPSQQPALNKPEDEDGEDDQNPEEYEPQVEFKPLVNLKEVEVKTGEENEDVVFKQRCKLYRFDKATGEWKEKGTGEMKILRNKSNPGNCRVLMRRDQVLKVCANHRITNDIKIEILNEKQVRWLANDCSEGQPTVEYLTARFRQEDDAKNFKAEFEKAQQQSSVLPQEETTKPITNQSNLASGLKKQEGIWACSTCLSNNKPDMNKCGACETPKPSSNANQSSPSSDFVEIISEVKATPEQILQARTYQLPDNFYLYLSKPDCKGCVGCSKEVD